MREQIKEKNSQAAVLEQEKEDEGAASQADTNSSNQSKSDGEGFSSPTKTARRLSLQPSEIFETYNKFLTGAAVDHSEPEEDVNSMTQSLSNIVEKETKRLEWGDAKDEEDRMKRKLAQNKRADILAGKKAVKSTAKKKKQNSKSDREEDKGSASPCDTGVNQ